MILDDIVAAARRRVAQAKEKRSLAELRGETEKLRGGAAGPPEPGTLAFYAALSPQSPLRAGGRPAFICEAKRASPSKGLIAPDFPHLEIARDYEEAGASAISVLTEPEFFLGSDQYLLDIAAAVKLPALRKDFIIDEYQIHEAKILGAKAVLLIAAILPQRELESFRALAASLDLDALVEIHTAEEAGRALDAGAGIAGINNRDLTTFAVDISTTEKLRPLIPPGVLAVSESGISGPEAVRRLRDCGVDAFLVGESLMRAGDRKKALEELRNA